MKKSEMRAGQLVEIKERGGYFNEAIILEVGNWEDRRLSEWSRPSRRRIEGAPGIAIARRIGWHDNVSWVPDVVRAQAIVPAGTQAAKSQEERAKWAREAAARDADEDTVTDIRKQIADIIGPDFVVSPGDVRRHIYRGANTSFRTGAIEIRQELLETLLDIIEGAGED